MFYLQWLFYYYLQVILQETSDISIAVATEAGLITPIVTNADNKALDEISAEIKELAGRARIVRNLRRERNRGCRKPDRFSRFRSVRQWVLPHCPTA